MLESLAALDFFTEQPFSDQRYECFYAGREVTWFRDDVGLKDFRHFNPGFFDVTEVTLLCFTTASFLIEEFASMLNSLINVLFVGNLFVNIWDILSIPKLNLLDLQIFTLKHLCHLLIRYHRDNFTQLSRLILDFRLM